MSILQRARAWLRDHVHVVNQNRKPSGSHEERHGSVLIEGTANIHDRGWRRDLARISWTHGPRAGLGRAEVSFDEGDGTIALSLGVPGAAYWFVLERVPRRVFEALPMNFRRPQRQYLRRSVGVKLHSRALWFSLWEDVNEWRHSDPKWMSLCIGLDDIANALFGKLQYTSEVLEEREVMIPMPEGMHRAEAQRTLARRTRPRWPWPPFSSEDVGVTIDIPGGIETDHKGPLYAISTRGRSIAAGVGQLVGDVFRSRGGFAPVTPPTSGGTEGGGESIPTPPTYPGVDPDASARPAAVPVS